MANILLKFFVKIIRHPKESAKTIDLCNNPLTKEPKLTAAARIVPEWTGFDEEIKILLNGKPNKTNDKKVEEKSDEKDEL